MSKNNIERRIKAIKDAIRKRQDFFRITVIEIFGDRGDGEILLERKSMTDDNGRKQTR